jgi:hypothetical protein
MRASFYSIGSHYNWMTGRQYLTVQMNYHLGFYLGSFLTSGHVANVRDTALNRRNSAGSFTVLS